MVKKISFLLIILILLSSCVVQQNLNIITDQGGWATTDLYVNDFFLGVLEDFEPFYEDLKTKSIMDAVVDDFVDNLHSTTSASAIGSIKIGDNSYFIDFDFSSLEKLLNELNKKEEQSIFRIVKRGSQTSLNFYLDIKNYPQLVKMVPFLADPNFETFGPLYNEGMSEQEYLEMISYILGEEGPSATDESVISLRVTLPKIILSHSNGTKESPNSIRFDIPLIDFLLLAKPITFSVSW